MSRHPIPKADRLRLAAWLPTNWQRGDDNMLAQIVWDELAIDARPELVKHLRHELRLLRAEHYEPPHPTEAEIAEGAAHEREHWTDRDYYVRAGEPVPPELRLPSEAEKGYELPLEKSMPRRNGREMIG